MMIDPKVLIILLLAILIAAGVSLAEARLPWRPGAGRVGTLITNDAHNTLITNDAGTVLLTWP